MNAALDWDTQRLARAALTFICEPGDARLAERVQEVGAHQVVCELRDLGPSSAWSRRALAVDAGELARAAQHHNIRFVIPSDEDWPVGLSDLANCDDVSGMRGEPFGLWLRGPGSLQELTHHSIAIVGSRAATSYGVKVASEMAASLTQPEMGGWTILSGGAYGIDAAAHRGAMSGGGTVGVYAGGLHESYPKLNSGLFDRMVREHLVVSEVPPGMHPTRMGFLARNRLIAALCQAVVVVESAARSGALNTASWADTLGRAVLAVPGPVTSALSVGTHRLIRDGRAQLVADADDVAAIMTPIGQGPDLVDYGTSRPWDHMEPVLRRVHEALPGRGTKSVGQIATLAGLDTGECLAALAELELIGLAIQNDDQRWRAVPMPALMPG